MLLPLLFLVPRKEGRHKPSAASSAAALAAVGADSGLAGQDVEVLTDGHMGDLDAAADLHEPLIGSSYDTSSYAGVFMPVAEAQQPVSVTDPPVGSFPVGSPYFA